MLPLPAGTPDGDERLHLVISEMAVVILGKGPALVWPGNCPSQVRHGGARGVQQSILGNEEVNEQLTEFKIFQLVIAALGALNPARPFYMLCVPQRGSIRKTREVARVCGACERERV